jgi:formate dehydrogenase iron-sulfur subunit
MSLALKHVGVLVDVTRCVGCNQCIGACVTANDLGEFRHTPQQAPDGLSDRRFSAIVESPQGAYVRKACRHCLQPACVSVCPVGAMYQTLEGVVLYDYAKCMGCRYCMMACPYGIPRYEWDSTAPRVRKCNLCYERLQNGQLPACVEACPEQVMLFGERDDLLVEARRRLQQSPNKYLPVVYGEREVGGASVLYISPEPLDFLGFHGAPGDQPFPELTWNWLSRTPSLALAMGGLMTGLFWVIGRRMQAEEKRAAKKTSSLDEDLDD